ERSPLHLIDGIDRPVILFQGLDDKVVPPEQSRLIADRLRDRGIKVAYHEFEGEGHGFRRADTIIRVLNEELKFLQSLFGLQDKAGSILKG
ncbi:MAG TPA: S9 family peptidase, partial [Rhizobiales bacterium]|nr:S9 family peptidase [Hyphomicrobiales bacterium]